MALIVSLILLPLTVASWAKKKLVEIMVVVVFQLLHISLHILMVLMAKVQLTGSTVGACVICLGDSSQLTAPSAGDDDGGKKVRVADAAPAPAPSPSSALEWRRRRRRGGGRHADTLIGSPQAAAAAPRRPVAKFWRITKRNGHRPPRFGVLPKRPATACCVSRGGSMTTSSSFGLPVSTCTSEPYWDGMVELCELHIFPEEDQWPPDIDTRIAALNFGGDSVLFESFDPSVSTDSLDSQQLREQCRVRGDDFQLAFADSGHWQSGVVTTNDAGNLTTWGRMRSAEPLEERTASAPDVTRTTTTTSTTTGDANRPASLIANFVANNLDTRFVDLNDNEIETTRSTDSELEETIRKDRWRRSSAARRSISSAPPRRTFADLEVPKMAPELGFLALHHEIPSLCESFTTSFRDVLLKQPRPETLPGITDPEELTTDNTPDSGLGCSGPSHIEDWGSLSVLLPKHVAEACSFFKNNTQLLTSSTASSSSAKPQMVHKTSNCIDSMCNSSSSHRKVNEPCRTCYRIRRRLHPPLWAQTHQSKTFLCDCLGVTESQTKNPGTSNARHCLRPKELSIIGMPIYATKRAMVERVVEGVAAISRGESTDLLVAAMTEVICDGLLDSINAWDMIKTVTSKGPATKDVFSTVKQLAESNKAHNVCVEIFFEKLIRENSLDCWLCYVVLKEKALQKLYKENAFLVAASGEYRTLLWRMVDSLALLPVLEAREAHTQAKSLHAECGGASRIASDSRVPKSSSVPARLSSSSSSNNGFASRSRRCIRRSRIPLLSRRDNSASSHHTTTVSTNTATASWSSLLATSQLAYATEPYPSGNFELEKDEQVRVLSCRDGLARCTRVHPKALQLCTGIVPVDKLAFLPPKNGAK